MNAVEFLDLFKLPLALLVGLVVVGGGAVVVLSGGGGGAAPPVMETVPATAEMVVTAEGEAVTADTTRQVVDAALNASGVREPANYSQLASLAGVGTGLSTDELRQIVAYGTVRGGNESDVPRDYLGVIVDSGWSESGFVAAVANGSETSEESHAGYTVHVVEDEEETWIGVVSEGRYVVGTEAAVKDALDVAGGEADPFEGDVRTALESVSDGSVRFASAVPREFLLENPTLNQEGLPVDFGAVKSIRVLAGSMQTGEQNVTVQLRLRSNTTGNAQQLSRQLDGFASIRAGMASSPEVSQALRITTFEQDEQTVVVSYEGPEEQFVPAFRILVDEPMGGLGGGGGFGNRADPQPAAPSG